MLLAFYAIQSGWWMDSKAFMILNTRQFVWNFTDYGFQNTEKSL